MVAGSIWSVGELQPPLHSLFVRKLVSVRGRSYSTVLVPLGGKFNPALTRRFTRKKAQPGGSRTPQIEGMAGEYEDKYLLLRDENTALKKKKNEQEATIKRMFTKLAMIEETMKKKRQVEEKNNQDDPETGGNRSAAVVPVRRDLDTEKFVLALKNENTVLRKKNQSLMEKNRWLEEQVRQPRASKRHNTAPTPTAQKKGAARNGGFAGNTLEKQTESARKLHRDTFSGDLEVALKKRVVIAEKQLVKLRQENEQLRANGNQSLLRPRRDNNEGSGPSDEDEDAKGTEGTTASNLELNQMKRELRDRQAQLAILNARYENLESNALAEREIQEKTLGQMEQMNRQVHKLRTQLQDVIMEKEELEIRLSKTGDQEKDITLLREQNRRLEERMTSLCESPFINDAFQRKERIDKLFDLEKLTQQQKTTITYMTEENQKLQVIIRELQTNIKHMKQAKDRVEQDLELMKQHLMEERNAKSLAAIKLTPNVAVSRPEPLSIVRPTTPVPQYRAPEKRDACSSPLNINQSTKKHSAPPTNMLTALVTRKYGDLPLPASFLDAAGAENDNSVKHLRNRVHVLQIAHLKSMQELERCEKMLHAQTNINRELALEIEELTTQKVSSSSQLQRRMKDLELLCEERQQRIHRLEAEVRQLKYAREKLLLKSRDTDDISSDSSSSDDGNSEVASLSESLVRAARDLAPGEQLLELGIVDANFDRSAVGVNSSTFVLCDFYDFESQSTPLLMGNRPEYNLSATFKVTVDGFFLRYLASECIALEVHQAIRGDFKLIGTASVRLSKLLHSKGVIKEPMLPVKSTRHGNDGENIALGTLNIVLRLSTPISEVWRLHLRSYPQDAQLLSMRNKGNNAVDPAKAICEADFADDSMLPVNELQVAVFACRNLRSYGEKQGKSVSRIPSSYAHYQLLGFPDIFTNIVPESSNPEYDLECSRQTFVLEVDACLLRFLSKFCFWITVFDDQVELEDNAGTDGMIGRCGLVLSDLVNGECVRGWFPLKDQNDRHVGDISILIQWKDPFQVLQLSSSQRARGVNGRPIDLHSLDFDQQHALLAMFSPEMDGQVNYRQFLHYAAPSEELELITAKIKERFEYAIDSEQIACVQDALYEAADPRARKSMRICVDTLTKAMEKHGIFLAENERTFLVNTFGIPDLAAGNQPAQKDVTAMSSAQQSKVMMHYLLLYINPRLSCVERLMCHKIRQTVRGYLQQQRKRKDGKALHPAQLFEKLDEAKCGRITRSEFRKCLSALGFDLLNVEAEYRELVRTHTKPPSPVSNGEGVIESEATQPIRDGIDLDEDVLVDSKTSAARQVQQALPLGGGASSEKRIPRKRDPTPECAMVESTANEIPAATEFQRRKQAFMDRMKAIASASSKNLVYEQLEKKHHQQQLDVEKQKAALSRQNVLQQALERLHAPQPVHQDAARTLQKQYRQYKEQQHHRREANLQAKHTIMEADLHLQHLLKKWTSAELDKLENELLRKIETDIPEAKQARVVSKKQLGYLLSQIPRIALPPALLAQLMDYFSVEQRGFASQVAYEPFLNFLCSTSNEESDHEKQQRQVVLKVLGGLCVDVTHATQTFVSVGDMNNTGCISFKKFRESLTRIGVHLTAKDVHLLMIMFDTNGFQILYHALLHTLQQLPQSSSLVQVLKRCQRFGVSTLREKLFVFVNTEDGLMTKHDLHHVLMEGGAQSGRFEPQDASALFEMMTGSPNSGERVSIQELCLRLEKTAIYNRPALNGWNKYDLGQLQRLAWNCRKLLCGSNSDLMSEFERFDWKESGGVARTEFVTIARRNGFVVFTDDQLNEIAKTFGTKTGGSFGIDYRQFLDWTTPPPPMQMDNIEAKLRTFAQTQADKANVQLSEVVTRWKAIFSAEAKPSQAGGIDRAHFVKICTTKLGLALNDDEVRTVLYTYDRQLDDEVDYNAFLLMNWKKTATTSRKVMQLDSKPASDRDIVANIKEKLQGRKGVKKEIAEAFSLFGDVDQSLVEESNFLMAMKQMGVLLSPDDVRALFSAFGVGLEKRKLNYVKFFKDSLDLPLVDVLHRRPEHQLSPESETRLKCALEAAGTYSLPAFQNFFVNFQEFCVVRQFADITPTNFWHEMKTNGLVNLLSKKGVGLLAQKFSITCCEVDDDDSADDANVNVSLKAVHAYLQDFLDRSTSAQVSRKREVPRQPITSSKGATSTRSPIGILSQLVDWCDEQGIDFRGEFETYDRAYAGFTSAMEFKQVLLRLGIGKIAAPLAPEAVIGQLVRQFRSPEVNDAVQYTAMLHEVTTLEPNSAQAQWYGRISEHLRSRIRVKANLVGKIDPSDTTNYCKLDAPFSHFDREKKGFLTVESLQSGLRALDYEISAEQRNVLMTHMSIFRHGGGGFSRTEFDSFVLDPYGFRLVKKLSQQLYSRAQQHQGQEAVPRIALLSRLLMESGGSHHERSLPKEVFWSQLEHTLERYLTTKERSSLQHLFDVNRDGEIAYKLFLKVISQWRTLKTSSGDPAAVEGSLQQGAPVQTIRTSERIEPEEKPPCPSDAILHSLHNQMSSIDFASQVDIVEEYLRRKDRKRTGAINMKKLKQIFDQIGLSLSADAFTSLQMYFPGSFEAKVGAPREASVSYEELLAALKKLHRESEDIN